MKHYAVTLLLTLAPLLAACDSNNDSGEASLSINGNWYLGEINESERETYRFIQVPSMVTYRTGFQGPSEDLEECWDIFSATLVQSDERVWSAADGDDPRVMYREGEALVVEGSISAGTHQKTELDQEEVSSLFPECDF